MQKIGIFVGQACIQGMLEMQRLDLWGLFVHLNRVHSDLIIRRHFLWEQVQVRRVVRLDMTVELERLEHQHPRHQKSARCYSLNALLLTRESESINTIVVLSCKNRWAGVNAEMDPRTPQSCPEAGGSPRLVRNQNHFFAQTRASTSLCCSVSSLPRSLGRFCLLRLTEGVDIDVRTSQGARLLVIRNGSTEGIPAGSLARQLHHLWEAPLGRHSDIRHVSTTFCLYFPAIGCPERLCSTISSFPQYAQC